MLPQANHIFLIKPKQSEQNESGPPIYASVDSAKRHNKPSGKLSTKCLKICQ